jgi:hypothetical protein
MITQSEAEALNTAAVLLRQCSRHQPPTIELGEIIVTAHIEQDEDGMAVIVTNIETLGVDPSSVLASPNGVRFAQRVNYSLTAGGVADLTDGQPAVARITTAAL